MKLGVISDIHSNFEALQATYKALTETGCDKIVCIGDVVGYGASPTECIDFLIEHEIQTVKGNHDHYTTQIGMDWEIQPYAREVIFWTQKHLDKERISWLKALPMMLEVEDVMFVHASLEALDGEYWPYILDSKSALFHFFLQDKKYAFFGHTHIPLIFTYDSSHKISIEILKSKTLEDNPDVKYLLNPGAVGQPRDFDCRSSSVIFDTETGGLASVRVEYDIKTAQKKIISAGLPEVLAERLSRGN